MNTVILIGNLTRDPELSYTPNTQTAVCRFDIAVNRPKRNGEDQGADYPRITVWGRQAENCGKYLSKGRKVAVRGRLQTGSYTNREGQKVYTTEVVADNVEFLSGTGNGEGRRESFQSRDTLTDREPSFGGNDTQNTGFSQVGGNGGFDDMPDTFQAAEDDIPF